MDLSIDENGSELYNVFERGLDFYKDIANHYKQHPDPDVTVLESNMENDSATDSKGGFEERNRKRIADLNSKDAIEETRVGGV